MCFYEFYHLQQTTFKRTVKPGGFHVAILLAFNLIDLGAFYCYGIETEKYLIFVTLVLTVSLAD